METFVIKTPSSSANIGPGFDVIGLALSVYLELHVTIDRSKPTSSEPLNCRITYEGEGEGDISLDPSVNLITRVALYVLRCHGQRMFPVETHVHVKNPIPLGRGLGSSGSAVVAGAMLGSQVGHLDLDLDRLFDFILMIERHPDNVGASLYGGFVGTYLRPLKPEDVQRVEIPLSEVLPAPAGGVDTGETPPAPPHGIGHHIKFPWAKEIKAVAIIPSFEVPTHLAREVLPPHYTRPDVVSLPSPSPLVLLLTSPRPSTCSASPCCPSPSAPRRPIPSSSTWRCRTASISPTARLSSPACQRLSSPCRLALSRASWAFACPARALPSWR